jgi:tungstate transport system substrate-binding protein
MAAITLAMLVGIGSLLSTCRDSSRPVRKVMLASTIGPVDAGIVGALEQAFVAQTGIPVEHEAAGTRQALELAQTGRFDVVLVHARALEDKFIADGYGTQRFDLMYNDFVILGPASDPAGIRLTKDPVAALHRIAVSKAPFVTRGDQSGTHIKEAEVWQKAGIKPQGGWYIVYGQGAKGNASTLAYANERQAYTIVDRATYIAKRSEVALQILVERDDILFNYMTLIPVNPSRFPGINHLGAIHFVEWLQGKEAQAIIRDFGKGKFGEALFYPNSPEGKKLSGRAHRGRDV